MTAQATPKRQENLPGKQAFPHGLSCLFPGQASLSGLAAFRRRVLGLREWLFIAIVLCNRNVSHASHAACCFIAVYIGINKTICERNGKQVAFRNDAAHATSCFVAIPHRGRAAMGRRPEGLPSGEKQKNARSRKSLLFIRRAFSVFRAASASFSDTQKQQRHTV